MSAATTNARLRGDAGQVMPMMAILTVAILALSGLVLDGGRLFAARREANALAASAARAGTQAVDDDALRDGHSQLDLTQAEAAAQDFLGRAGVTGTVTAYLDHVDVEVTVVAHPVLLTIVGMGDKPITGHGSARIIRGI